MKFFAVLSMLPQLGAGGCWPRPRNDRLASAMIAAAIASVDCTITGAQDVRQHVAPDDPERRVAERARRLDVVLDLDVEHLGARQANEDRHRRDADRDHRVGEVRAEERRQRDRQDQEREGEHRVGQARDQASTTPPTRPAIMPIGTPSATRDRDRDDAGEQRRARAPDDARQHVAADVVGAEPVRRRRRLAYRAPARLDRIVRREPAARAAPRTMKSATTTRPIIALRRRVSLRHTGRQAPGGGTRAATSSRPAAAAARTAVTTLTAAQPRVDREVGDVGEQVERDVADRRDTGRRPARPRSRD